MRDYRDYFGYAPCRCGECIHYEPRYTNGTIVNGQLQKRKLDRGDCTRFGLVVTPTHIDESGCYERD